MDRIRNMLLIACIAVEYFSFFYAVYRKEFREGFGWREAVLSVTDLCLIVLSLVLADRGVSVELVGLPAVFLFLWIFFSLSFFMCMKLFFAALFIMSLFVSTESFLFDCFGIHETKGLLICYYLTAIVWIWGLFLLTKNRLLRKAFSLDGKFGTPLMILYGIITAMITSYQFLFRHKLQTSLPQSLGAFLGGAGGILIFFMYFILLYYINTNHDYQEKLFASELYNEQQRMYFRELLERERQTRKFRHDHQAELLIMDTYLKKGEYDKASAYLSQMREALERTFGLRYQVGNEIMDIILNYYLQGVPDRVDITVSGAAGDMSRVSERDLTVIVSNLVRNAVEELQVCTEKEPVFVFECRETEGDFMICTRNSIASHGGKRRKREDMHQGLGLLNIKETAEKYGGAFFWRIRDQLFEAQIRIPICRSS